MSEGFKPLLLGLLAANSALAGGATFDAGNDFGLFWLCAGVFGAFFAGRLLITNILTIVGDRALFSETLRRKRNWTIFFLTFACFSILVLTHFRT